MRKCYALMALLAVLALGLFAGAALAAGNAKPPAPPGQGECAHGNSGKPCKEDPQPEKGKDCEEHGPKNGGVNEDHCKGTTPEETEPSTPDTTTTSPEDLPTTGSTGNSEDRPSSDSPAPETGSSSGGSTPSEPGVSKPTLEEELEEQAQSNGAPAAESSPAAASTAADTLPYTGFETWMAVVIGLGLSGIGLALRRWAK